MLTVQEKIQLLLWDRRYVSIPKDIDSPNRVATVVIMDPTLEDKNYYLFVRECEEKACERDDVPGKEEIFAAAREAEFWTKQDDKIIKETENHIMFLESEITRQKFEARKRNLQKQIETARNNYSKTVNKRENLRLKTREYLAHEAATFSLLQRIVYTLDGNRLWPTERIFVEHKQRYLSFVVHLAHAYLDEGGWDIKDIRQVARSGEWRLIWVLQRENLSVLFNKPVGDFSSPQKILIYWSRVYDSVYEDTDKPNQDIIDDDDLLDEWLANRDLDRSGDVSKNLSKASEHQEQMQILDGYYVETCTCGASKVRAKGLGEKTPHTVDCPYGTWCRYTQEEKEELSRQIYGRNTDGVRQLLDKEQDAIETVGTVEEQHLRKKKTRALLGSDQKVIPIRR